MAHEFSKMMDEFSRLAMNYCENAKKFMPTSDHVKLVEVYQVGLAAMLEGTWSAFREVYAATSESHRDEIDRFVKMTGMIPMLQAANRLIGPHTTNPHALFDGASIFEKPKSVIREIPNFIPIVGWAAGALRLIDELIRNIRDLIPKSDKTTTDQSGSVHDGNIRTTQLLSCQPFTFEVPDGPRDVRVDYGRTDHAGKEVKDADLPEIEVTSDGAKQPSLTGKKKSEVVKNTRKITLHLKGAPGEFFAQIKFTLLPK
jgi:hypothetical protein